MKFPHTVRVGAPQRAGLGRGVPTHSSNRGYVVASRPTKQQRCGDFPLVAVESRTCYKTRTKAATANPTENLPEKVSEALM